MLTLDRFLFCRLEVGGYFLGIYCSAINILTVASSIYQIRSAGEYDCEEFVSIWSPSLHNKVQDAWCPYVQRVAFTVLSFNIFYGLGLACIGCMCVQGMKTRNHSLINPMRIFLTIHVSASLAVAVLFALFIIPTFLMAFITIFIVAIILYMATLSYFLIIINSIYKMFKQEYENKANQQQYMPPKYKVSV